MRPALSILLAIVLGLAGCGEDDGADVREVGAETSVASGSASGSASASGSGSAVAEAARCAPVGDPTESDATVVVTLDEWGVVPSPAEVPAGLVTFIVRNEGEKVHEVVVVQAESRDDLEVSEGQVQEDALPEGAFIGEVEGFPSESTCDGTFELEAGDYVLFCNILETEDDGTMESHYEEGMVTEFTVTEA